MVEVYSRPECCSAAKTRCTAICATLALTTLPADPTHRGKELLRLYTGDLLYGSVNKALYTNDAGELDKYGAYIWELRAVFRLVERDGQLCTKHSIIRPFFGTCARGCNMPAAVVEEQKRRWKRGQLLCWSSFTSTSAGTSFGGNVKYSIDCGTMATPKSGQYYPCNISDVSEYPGEREVLWPPHCSFRLVNVLTNADGTHTVEMETVEFPSVWELVKEELWEQFERWAEAHRDKIDTGARSFSIIGDVARCIKTALVAGVNPIKVCVKHGANINEVDCVTKETPVMTVAKRHKALVERGEGDLSAVLRTIIEHGGNMFMASDNDTSAADVLGAAALWCIPAETAQWEYYVDDGVDGKEAGWYVYATGMGAAIEARFQEWLSSGSSAVHEPFFVEGGGNSYEIRFAMMSLSNSTTRQQRKIRRAIGTAAAVPLDAGLLPGASAEMRKQRAGFCCCFRSSRVMD
eukprot:NODE_2525_length_2196_cov_6.381344.p1 GENE.NODE_2525_length_2196_cov_6.381344~~NODE_2525_length_2196_cov_6.381344.p1  ORF type:complete len:463 (-),score=104.45 NODE_2525_length_2196_cov_6.381344:264-1652(-)